MTVAAFCKVAHGIPFRKHEEQSLRQWLTAVRGALATRCQELLSPLQFLDLMGKAALAGVQPSQSEQPANAVPADAALDPVVELARRADPKTRKGHACAARGRRAHLVFRLRPLA